MVEKAPDAFRNISEVAGLLDVPAHVLRFWETRFSQIKPIKRSGGRRYYRPDDIALLKRIRALLYEQGYTIKGAQQVLRTRNGNGNGAGHGGPEDCDANVVGLDAANGADNAAAASGARDRDVERAIRLLREAETRLGKL